MTAAAQPRDFTAERRQRARRSEAADDAMAGRRPPPHDPAAERGVLAAVTWSPTARAMALGQLEARHFYLPQHALIWGALVALVQGNRELDALIVKDWLRTAGTLDEAGGEAFVDEVLTTETSGLHIGEYVEILLNQTILRGLHHLAQEMLADVHAGGAGTGADMAANYTGRLVQIGADKLTDRDPRAAKTADDIFNEIQQAQADGFFKVDAFATGYPHLDDLLDGGFKPGQFVVIGARPGVGKTTLMLNILANSIRRAEANHARTGEWAPEPSAVFSLEMGAAELGNNLLACVAQVDGRLISKRTFFADVRDNRNEEAYRATLRAIELVKAHDRLWLEDTNGLNIQRLAMYVKQYATKGAKAVFVDYLQLLKPTPGRRFANREQEVGDMSHELKAIARANNVPVIVLAQVNRQPAATASGEPGLQDLRESGAIEADADIVLLPYRLAGDENTVLARIAKQRNGPTTQGETKNPRWKFTPEKFLLTGGASLEAMGRGGFAEGMQ